VILSIVIIYINQFHLKNDEVRVIEETRNRSFVQYLIGGGKIEDLMGDIDIRKAHAHNESDLQNIRKIVDESIGHGRLNELVSSEMRKCFVSCAESSLEQMPPDERIISDLHLNTMKMYLTLGRLTEADAELTSRHEKQILLLSSEPIKVAETLCELATVKSKLGQLKFADELFCKAFEMCYSAKEENPELLGNIYNRFGSVKDKQGYYDEALLMYEESLTIKEEKFGTGHVSVASTLNNMAIVERKRGNLQKALELYERSLEINLQRVGNSHVSVADTQNNIAGF
jgi:tetratricopeptide (TPR) repeat protein